jgi:hypothetical protein
VHVFSKLSLAVLRVQKIFLLHGSKEEEKVEEGNGKIFFE